MFPEGYDNFGETPFTPSSGKSDRGRDDEAKEKEEALSNLKDSVLAILKRSNFVAQSTWRGHRQQEEDNWMDIKREDYFFFEAKDGKKFLLKFGWSFLLG